MRTLRSFTEARVALRSAGHALATREQLQLALDHARARDAVEFPLGPLPLPGAVRIRSQAPDRRTYLVRPDLGRRVHPADLPRIEALRGEEAFDAALVVADGLSPLAVERHAAGVAEEVQRRLPGWRWAPPVVVEQGRVAIGDEIGERLGAAMVLVLIGERPGMSSPDSLGAYLTFAPRPGRTDAERNCLSNIRAEGMPYALAAEKLAWLMREARGRRLTGVALKDETPAALTASGRAEPSDG